MRLYALVAILGLCIIENVQPFSTEEKGISAMTDIATTHNIRQVSGQETACFNGVYDPSFEDSTLAMWSVTGSPGVLSTLGNSPPEACSYSGKNWL